MLVQVYGELQVRDIETSDGLKVGVFNGHDTLLAEFSDRDSDGFNIFKLGLIASGLEVELWDENYANYIDLTVKPVI